MAEKHTPYSLSDWLGYLSHEEVDFLANLVYGLPPKPKVVNIGAGGGTSGLTILAARPDSYLYTVDIALESNPLGGLGNEREILEAHKLYDVGRNLQLLGDSPTVGKKWDRGEVDMVFVDGNHSYEGCRDDILNWMPHIKEGGVMAVHDYEKVSAWAMKNPTLEINRHIVGFVIKPYPGVDIAVREFLNSRYEEIDVVDTLIAFRK